LFVRLEVYEAKQVRQGGMSQGEVWMGDDGEVEDEFEASKGAWKLARKI
jgi:hypothetical protein